MLGALAWIPLPQFMLAGAIIAVVIVGLVKVFDR